MATNSNNVGVAVTGAVLVGLTSATAPTGTGGATTGFTDLGYLSEDGITEGRDRSTNDITAFQNGDVVRSVVTGASLTFSFTMIETNAATVELYYGTTVNDEASAGDYVIVPANTGGRKSFIIDVVDGAEIERTYIPNGEVTEVGERSLVNGESIGYEVTITAYPNSTIGGNAKRWATRLKTPA